MTKLAKACWSKPPASCGRCRLQSYLNADLDTGCDSGDSCAFAPAACSLRMRPPLPLMPLRCTVFPPQLWCLSSPCAPACRRAAGRAGGRGRRAKAVCISYPPCLSLLRRLCAYSHHQLAEIAPFQHADERFGRILQTVDEVLAISDTTMGDSRSDIAQECGRVFGGKFVVDEAAHRQALRQDGAHGFGQMVGAVARPRAVVLRDQAGDRDARKLVEQRQHGLPDRPADVLEIDINPIGTCSR